MPDVTIASDQNLDHSLGNGLKDNIQVYNIPKFDGFHQRDQPSVLGERLDEIEAFSRVRRDAMLQVSW